MSSGTGFDPGGVNDFLYSDASTPDGAGAGTDMNPRQLELTRLWSFYRCTNYANRTTDWNGGIHTEHVEHSSIATQGYVPPGFIDKGRQMLPLKFRRPTAPYYLIRVVVERFTGLLFGEKRRPKIVVEGDPATTDFIEGLIEAGRLWPAMLKARAYGGAMGSVAMGFSLINGTPTFEVFDPRWCTPVFADRHRLTLKALEVRYVFTEMARDDDGEWVQKPYWYRRLITPEADAIWDKVPADQGEPRWYDDQTPRRIVEHKLGICPAIWIQNTSNDDDIDGDPDGLGAYDLSEAYDALMAQANKGTLANADPTLLITSDSDLPPDLQKGSDNAIQLEKGGSAQYLELQGMGPKAARELATEMRERAFEVVACVPDNAIEGPQQTATEVVTRLSRMLERADVFREQYGEQGVKRIIEVALVVCRAAIAPRQEQMTVDGETITRAVRGAVNLPPKAVEQEDGSIEYAERRLGPLSLVKLSWPRYLEPTLDDATKAVDSAQKAVDLGVMDKQAAAEWLAQFLPLGNTRALLSRIEAAQAAAKKEEEEAMARYNAGGY